MFNFTVASKTIYRAKATAHIVADQPDIKNDLSELQIGQVV